MVVFGHENVSEFCKSVKIFIVSCLQAAIPSLLHDRK
jgi:hypothetical protein